MPAPMDGTGRGGQIENMTEMLTLLCMYGEKNLMEPCLLLFYGLEIDDSVSQRNDGREMMVSVVGWGLDML